MKNSLLRSFLMVLVFWWVVLALGWSLANPDSTLVVAQRLQALIPFINLGFPSEATIFNAWKFQFKILWWWTLPVLAVAFLSALLGSLIVGWKGWNMYKDRQFRERSGEKWRGVEITLGEMPCPGRLPMDEIELALDHESPLDKLTPAQKAFIDEVLGTLSAHPNAYCGEGLGVSILDHTLKVLEKALENKNCKPLSLMIAAAQDIGKITAYVKDHTGEWERVKHVGSEGAKRLAHLPSWWELDPQERLVVAMAVKFAENPKDIPDFDGEDSIKRKVIKYLDSPKEAQEKAVQEEKAKVLESKDLPELVVDAFLSVLPSLAFQSPGLPKGVKAVGWKKGKRLFLLEIPVREKTMAKIDKDVAAALGGAYREKSKLAPFTAELLKGFDKRGWLFREHGMGKLGVQESMWKIQSGTHEFKGVIIIDIPDDILEVLPNQDTRYDIKIAGPHFEQLNVAISQEDLSSLLKPSTYKKKEGETPAEKT